MHKNKQKSYSFYLCLLVTGDKNINVNLNSGYCYNPTTVCHLFRDHSDRRSSGKTLRTSLFGLSGGATILNSEQQP